MPRVQFRGWECEVEEYRYASNRIALVLVDPEYGERVAVATINVPDEPLGEDEVIVKDYSENWGMLNALLDAEVVSNPIRYIQTGFVTAPVCRVLR